MHEEVGASMANLTADEATLFHSTTIDKMFQVWKSGCLEPQVFEGGEHSTCPSGLRVIFAYKCEKKKICKFFENHDVVLEFSSNFFLEGRMELTGNYILPEYYVRESVTLKRCQIHADKKFLQYVVRATDLGSEEDCSEAQAEINFIKWLLEVVHLLSPSHRLFRPLV
jgi:hypothetical protein